MAEEHITVTEVTHPVDHPHKPIEITLAWYVKEYKVTGITNTTWYKPGQWLSVAVVQRLCDLPGWDVRMVDNDLLGTLLGMADKALPLTTVL